MEKRMIGAIALCVAAYFLFTLLFPPPKGDEAKRPPVPPPSAATSTATPAPPVSPTASPANVTSEAAPAEAAPAAVAAAPQIPDSRAAAVKQVMSTDLFQLTVNSQGGFIEKFVLNRYIDKNKKVDLILDPQPLANQALPAGEQFLSLHFPAGALPPATITRLNADAYTVLEKKDDRQPHPVSGASEPCRTIVLTLVRDGVRASKEISFWPDLYTIRVKTEVVRGAAPIPHFIRLGPGITNSDLTTADPTQIPPHAVYSLGDSLHTLQGEAIGREKRLVGSVAWAGVQTKYFAAVAIPRTPYGEVLFANRDVAHKPKPTEAAQTIRLVSTFVPGGETYLFMGPKAYDVLSAVRHDLTQTLDYGMFSFIVKPLYYFMRFIHQYVANMGLVLILLTLAITLALFPLRFHQMRSMKKMQVIQPQIKAIQAKYRGRKSAQDRQNMNQEMMALYKEAGVNPMGGCLPLLAQLPFLFAFYNLVSQSIEFWRQPFVLWLQDLSSADPTWITPILMGASMIIQMKQTPTAPGQDNRTQKMMMWVMPVLMTFMFMNLASGLVVYFLFSNLFSWGMQVVADKFMKKPKVQLASAPGKLRKNK